MEFIPTTIKQNSIKKGIVDADSIMFFMGWYFDNVVILLPPNETYIDTEVPEAIQIKVRQYHDQLLIALDVDEIEYHFTGSGRNRHLLPGEVTTDVQFRTLLSSNYGEGVYKENRDFTSIPTGYSAVLKTFLDQYNATIHFDIEADDAVVQRKIANPNWVLASNDKDVYMQCVGKHYNYDKRKRWVTTTIDEANRMPYLQAIAGDAVDGFKGAKGKGKAWVNKHLPLGNGYSPYQMWEVVLKAYKEAGSTSVLKDALFNMRMANMHQWKGDRLEIFTPPKCDDKHIFTQHVPTTG